MNIIDAANATVHNYLGGSESLGPRLGLSAAVLRNKVNPRNGIQQLSIAEADRLMELTGDFRMLKALAHQHGFLLVESPDPNASGADVEMLERAVCAGIANGEFRLEDHVALAEGRIDEKELRAVRAAERALQAVASRVTQRRERAED